MLLLIHLQMIIAMNSQSKVFILGHTSIMYNSDEFYEGFPF